MSVRLDTRPWLTKNLAAGWLDMRVSSGHGGWTVRRMVPHAAGRDDPFLPSLPARLTPAYDPGHAPGTRYRQHQRHAGPVPGRGAAGDPPGGHEPAGDGGRIRGGPRGPSPARRPLARRC